tara:strand:- start:8 stop:376 length:369 start_codon:yes stop_codon:yes gene_type:complete
MRTLASEIERLKSFIVWGDEDVAHHDYTPQVSAVMELAGVPNCTAGRRREAWRYELPMNERLRLYGLDFNESPMPEFRVMRASMVQEVPTTGMTPSEYEAWWQESEQIEHDAAPAYLGEVSA